MYERPNGFAYRGMFTDDKPNGTGEVMKLGKNSGKEELLRDSKKEKMSLRQTVELKSTQLYREPPLKRKNSDRLTIKRLPTNSNEKN